MDMIDILAKLREYEKAGHNVADAVKGAEMTQTEKPVQEHCHSFQDFLQNNASTLEHLLFLNREINPKQVHRLPQQLLYLFHEFSFYLILLVPKHRFLRLQL